MSARQYRHEAERLVREAFAENGVEGSPHPADMRRDLLAAAQVNATLAVAEAIYEKPWRK